MSKKMYAIPPGETIAELLEQRGITEKDLAAKMHAPESYVRKLIAGTVYMTIGIAHRLENALEVPANFWLNLEQIYREELSKGRTS